MPASLYYTATLTGLSSDSGYLQYFPDTTRFPFSLSVACTNTSTQAFTVEHSLSYTGSSTFVSTAATWFPSSGITAATTSAFTAYTYPVTAIRLNSTGGSSTATVTMTIVQAG